MDRMIETICHEQPDVARRMSEFVLLRVDIDRSAIPRSHRVATFPTYIVFDPDERELIRVGGSTVHLLAPNGSVDRVRVAAPAFLEIAKRFNAQQDLEASFLMAGTYAHLKMPYHARAAYVAAQVAEVQEA